MEVKTIGVLGASPNNRNLGVSALAAGIIESFIQSATDQRWKFVFFIPFEYSYSKKIVLHNNEVEIVVSNYKINPIKNIKRNLFIDLLLLILIFFLPNFIKKGIINKRPFLRDIQECLIITDIYGGDSFTDIYGTLKLCKSFLLRLMVLILKKEYYLLPQTIGPFSSLSSKIIAKCLIASAKKVFIRDYASETRIENLQVSKRSKLYLKYSPDVAFIAGDSYVDNFEFERWLESCDVGTIGINGSGLLYHNELNDNIRFNIKDSYFEIISLICKSILERGYRIILVPHTYQYPINFNEPHYENDAFFLQKVKDNLPAKYQDDVYIIQKNYDSREIRFFIKRCDFFIGTRMHSCIAAMSFHIPTVGLAYSDKYIGLFETLEVGDTVCDLRELTVDTIISKVLNIFMNRERIKKILDMKIPVLQEKIIKSFQEILGEY